MYNIRKKLIIQSWENLVTDGQTEGQTDESDFIGRIELLLCGDNVKYGRLSKHFFQKRT